MKKNILILLACLVSAGAMLTSCQDVQSPINTVPYLNEVTVTPNSKMDLNYTISHINSDYTRAATSGYFLVSESPDIKEENALRLDASRSNSSWTASVDLLPSTTYYIKMILESDHGSVSGPVTSYTTSDIDIPVYIEEINTNSAHFYCYWKRNDVNCKVYFQVSTNPDMSSPTTYDAYNNYSNSYYYSNAEKLSSSTTYYVRACIQFLSNGMVYYTATREFTTLTPASVSLEGTEYSQTNAGFWIVGDNTNYASNWSGTSWSGYITGEADVYVYKPYKKSNSNYKAIPIYYTDNYFEYGHTKISPTNTKVSCPMTILLPYQVNLNISCQSTNGATSSKYITRVEIANAENAQAICTNATFDLTNGTMTPTKSHAATWPKSAEIALSYEKTSSVYFNSLIPIKFSDGEVKVNITLNNSTNMNTEVIPVTLPSTSWEYGKQYNYNITVKYTRTDVTISVSDVYVQPWSNGGNTDIDIYD